MFLSCLQVSNVLPFGGHCDCTINYSNYANCTTLYYTLLSCPFRKFVLAWSQVPRLLQLGRCQRQEEARMPWILDVLRGGTKSKVEFWKIYRYRFHGTLSMIMQSRLSYSCNQNGENDRKHTMWGCPSNPTISHQTCGFVAHVFPNQFIP